jgi:2-keto-4-pentenoate hydratase
MWRWSTPAATWRRFYVCRAPSCIRVADYMSCIDGGEIKVSELIHPKVEAEICVVTKSPLKGPGVAMWQK